MAQYYLYLALVPIAFGGIALALALPRLVYSYQRFSWLTIFNLIQLGLVVNVVELFTLDPELKRILASVDYIFQSSWAMAWFFFSLEYTGILRKKRPWQTLFFVLPVVSCLCGILAPSLIWTGLRFHRQDWLLVMSTAGYGPMAITLFAQCYCLLLAGAVVLIRHTVMGHTLFRRQTALMLVGALVPTLVNVVFVLKAVPGWTKDFSAIMAALGGLCFSIGCLRYRLFSVVPVSRQKVFEQLRVGYLVTDSAGTIIDLNVAACRILGKSEIALLGRPAQAILEVLEQRTRLVRSPLTSSPGGPLEGWHIEIRDSEAGSSAEAPNSQFVRDQKEFLSLGELRVVEMLAQNLSNKEIGDRLGLSVNTVKFHLSNVYAKTGARGRAELVHRVGEITSAKATIPART